MTDQQWREMGNRIRMARKIRNITAKEMIRLTGYSKTHLQELENGKGGAALELLVVIAELFNLSLDYLILGISPIPSRGTIIAHLKCGEEAKENPNAQSSNDEAVNLADLPYEELIARIEWKSVDDLEDIQPEYYDESGKRIKSTIISWVSIGRRIREMRQHCGATLVELADFVHISKSHMSNIEHGRKAASVDIIVAIVQALGATIDYIVRGIRPVIGAGNWK